ncbi:MAG: SLBB domain-containing protein [Candidatus Cloacimonetes bacterium]|nr:SLBB domain-containing protein [Candidatus Cloacimonadota bacterium]
MKKLGLLMFLLIISGLVWAQDETTFGENRGSIYLYSGTLTGTEQLKIKTYIWGQVRNPGLYIIPDNTNLLTLISSAGGPTENAKLTKVRIIRPTSEGEKVIWVNLKKYIETGDESLIPIMQPEDTVVVAGTTFYAFSKITDWLSKAVIVISVYSVIRNIK